MRGFVGLILAPSVLRTPPPNPKGDIGLNFRAFYVGFGGGQGGGYPSINPCTADLPLHRYPLIFFQRKLYIADNPIDIVHHVIVPKADDFIAMRF